MANLNLVHFRYVNHRDEVSNRRCLPVRVWFGSTCYHPEPQWFLEGFDLDRQETRDYALAGLLGPILGIFSPGGGIAANSPPNPA